MLWHHDGSSKPHFGLTSAIITGISTFLSFFLLLFSKTAVYFLLSCNSIATLISIVA